MDLYNFDYKRMKPAEQLPLHKQDTWELTYVTCGKGKRIMGDTVTDFVEGDLAFIPPHIPHCWKFDDNHNTTALIADMLHKMAREQRTELLPYMFRLLLLISKNERDAVVVGRTPETDRTSERINKIKEFSQQNFARTVTIDMIAEHVGMNRSSFCTFFKKATGQTYITYLNKLRVDRACSLLRQGNFNVTEVCYMVGFNDVPYFNRCFKNNRGMSPKEYADGVISKRQVLTTRQMVPEQKIK